MTRIAAADTRRHWCSTCEKKTTFFGWFQEWYGWNLTCLNCGDQWQDGDAIERPFARGWRKTRIEHAKLLMEECKSLPKVPPFPPVS